MSKLYGIVDTARDPRLYPLVAQSPNHECLFAGKLADPLKRTAPYLVELTEQTPLKHVWQAEGWGQAWGILLRSPLELGALRKHLRKFLLAELPDGEAVLFRFYDPRVWRVYWANTVPEEQAKWLNGVAEFIAEPEHQAA